MSEEQPQFKVTDRRLFNADGTPREMEEAEAAAEKETEAAASAATASENVSTASGAQSSSAPTQASEPAREEQSQLADAPTTRPASADRSSGGASAAREDEANMPDADEEIDAPGMNDPASFVNFLMSIASNAAAALGMMEHPVTGERGVDLQLGKHWIDVLGMLEEKTRGNLDPQEARIMEGLLSDLRMQFVSLANTTPAAKQKFTGRDIIGGR